MGNDDILNHLKEMEQNIKKLIDEAKIEIIDEIETTLMEIGVYKKEIIDKISRGAGEKQGKKSK